MTREQDAAVIPTGYDPGSYSCVRSLAGLDVAPIIASEHDNVPAAASRFCAGSVRLPAPNDDLVAYKDALVELAARPSIRTLLPLRPYDPYVFARYPDEFAQHVSLVTPLLETYEQVTDRLALAAAADEAGVPMPRTVALDDAENLDADMVVKSRYNLLTDRNCDSVRDGQADTVKAVHRIRGGATIDHAGLRAEMGHEPIAQEFVHGSGQYVFGALYDHGEALATFQHRQIRGDSYTGGGGVYRESVAIPELERVGRAILDRLDYHGLACIEYMRDAETGEFELMEINPRLWQSLPCAVRAGADFPAYYWLLATGSPESIDPGYDVGVRTHLLYGEFGYLQSILADESALHERPSLLAAAASVGASCLLSPNFDDLRFDDPRPFLSGVAHVFRN